PNAATKRFFGVCRWYRLCQPNRTTATQWRSTYSGRKNCGRGSERRGKGSELRSIGGLLRPHTDRRILEQPCAFHGKEMGRRCQYSCGRTESAASGHADAIWLHERVRSFFTLGQHATAPRPYRVW